MSSFKRLTKHPITKEWKTAWWIDDFFGNHNYGVRFTDDGELSEKGETFREEDYEWETDTGYCDCKENDQTPNATICNKCHKVRK